MEMGHSSGCLCGGQRTVVQEKLLDCGHPEDPGQPAQVQNNDGKMETVQGWTFVLLEDGRKVCHACADKVILDCGHPPSKHEVFTTGYGVDKDGKKSCYACCAENDKKAMIETGRATMYLTGDTCALNSGLKVTNWPGSLVFPVYHHRVGRHNIAGKRIDVWFVGPDGYTWHGKHMGSMSQLVHCKKTKEK